MILESRDKGIAVTNTARDSKKTKDQEGKPAKGKNCKKEDTKPKSKKDDEESSKPRWKNAPPKGTSAEDWAEEQREKNPQYEDGKCAHCGVQGHAMRR